MLNDKNTVKVYPSEMVGQLENKKRISLILRLSYN